MIIASYILFGLFILTSIVHLVFCFLKIESLRKISKVFCVGFLAISLILRIPNYPLIYIGAIFGAIGDYFLIHKERPKSLALGIVTFFIGHIFYGLQILYLMKTPTWGFIMFYVLEIVLELSLVLILYPRMKYTFHGATGPGVAYFTILGTNFGLSIIMGIVTQNVLGAILLGIGYATFIASDTILLFTAYLKKWKRDDFYIMLTYLLAQALITAGLVVMVLGI